MTIDCAWCHWLHALRWLHATTPARGQTAMQAQQALPAVAEDGEDNWSGETSQQEGSAGMDKARREQEHNRDTGNDAVGASDRDVKTAEGSQEVAEAGSGSGQVDDGAMPAGVAIPAAKGVNALLDVLLG